MFFGDLAAFVTRTVFGGQVTGRLVLTQKGFGNPGAFLRTRTIFGNPGASLVTRMGLVTRTRFF